MNTINTLEVKTVSLECELEKTKSKFDMAFNCLNDFLESIGLQTDYKQFFWNQILKEKIFILLTKLRLILKNLSRK